MNTHHADRDTLLDIENDQKHRGKLKIFFGAAPGVGKTYAMLSEAIEKKEEGIDVVIGWVDTHQRVDTEQLLTSLEVIPRLTVFSGENRYSKLNVEAIVKRHPAICIIDELPHQNMGASRHKKRWQDIDEILDLGIDVWSAMNVQHLESMNEIIKRITDVSVKETVPDRFFEQADEVRLVDLPPDDLIKRLKAGKVYLSDRIAIAQSHFFKRSNLIALRELSLSFVANRMKKQRQSRPLYSAKRIKEETGYGVLLVLDKHDHDLDDIREVARFANALTAQWHVVWVDSRASMKVERQKSSKTIRFAKSLGAQTALLLGEWGQEISRYAQEHNLNILIYVSHTVFVDYLRRKELDQLMPQSLRIVLKSKANKPSLFQKIGEFFIDNDLERKGYFSVAFQMSLLTLLLWPIQYWIDTTNIAMLYLLGVLYCGLRYGSGPASFATVVGILYFDLTMIDPKWSFSIDDSQHLITIFVMLMVGVISGRLVSKKQKIADQSHEQLTQMRLLYQSAEYLSKVIDKTGVVRIISQTVRLGFKSEVAFYLKNEALEDDLELYESTLENVDPSILKWCQEKRKSAGKSTQTLSSSAYYYHPLVSQDHFLGVAVLDISTIEKDPDLLRGIHALMSLSVQAFDRLQTVEESRQALIVAEADRMRHSLIQSLSHDLRTPLTLLSAGLERVNTLLKKDEKKNALFEAERVLIASKKMERMVINLLEMARLQNQELMLNKEWVFVEEIFGDVLRMYETQLNCVKVNINIEETASLIYVDSTLITKLLENLIDNSLKYALKEQSVPQLTLEATKQSDMICLRVCDNGPGIEEGQVQRVFDPFKRGKEESATFGVGLGLAICRTIARAHEGEIFVGKSECNGACFNVLIPYVDLPAPMEE